MRKLRIYLVMLLLLGVLVGCYVYRTDIVSFVMKNLVQHKTIAVPNNNAYNNAYTFKFVQNTNNFRVKNRQDILNTIYTVLNSGEKDFTFYCDKDYSGCNDEIKKITEDQELLSVINNMVSPFNSYKKLFVTINSYGKATITVDKLYSDEEINVINQKQEEIINQIIKDNMTDREKIKAYHDYLINHSVYDEQRAKLIEDNNDENPKYNSHKANGPLLEGWALCSGYSDAMKLFLDKLNLPNYKIANEKHIWNLVYIDDQWLHIDLTWDDPVTSDHSNILLHKFFLITTDELLKLDKTDHEFNIKNYPELSLQ